MRRPSTLRHLSVCLAALAATSLACGGALEADELPDGYDPSITTLDDEYGKPLLDPEQSAGKADTLYGVTEMDVSADRGNTAVWEVRNQWEDTDTAAAREAGIAWGASSGLNWDEKYQAWIASMEKTGGHDTYYETFELTTPWGKNLPAPVLECAEVAIFLRATFASWYQLPFFMAGGSGSNRLVFGHFGALKVDGSAFGPAYKSRYRDYSDMSADDALADWPRDAGLRKKRLGGSQDDYQPAIEEGARAGAYMDEAFLNKRVGHFMLLLLSYFGSVNLASTSNTYNLVPEALQPGDVLLERWQRRGIGHTLVTKTANRIEGGRIEAELLSGSMPRRQPKWDEASSAKSYFTNPYTGGSGMSGDGVTYAELGGGLKRFRVSKVRNGRWSNQVMNADASYFIPEGDFERLGERPEEFESLLGEVSPEEKRDALLRKISDQRNHLRRYPASCSARIRREEAFVELYGLMGTKFSLSKREVDAEYRELEDYVFAELVYEQSKTCCWNSTTDAMYEIVMDYNRELIGDGSACVEPAVFKERGGDYSLFRDHAVSLGRGDEWVAWSEDEPCAQRGSVEGVEAETQWTPWCTVAPDILGTGGGGGPTGCTDVFGENQSRESAADVSAGAWSDLQVCEQTSDWFRVSVSSGQQISARITFDHASGDLDLKLHDSTGNRIDSSESTSDQETVVGSSADGVLYIEVFGYRGIANAYAMEITY